MTKTTERRGNGGAVETRENQQQVFTGFPTPLGIRQPTPDSHIPTAPVAVAPLQTKKSKTRKESAAARPPLPDLFQDHLVLETLPRFRIIRRLENAISADCGPDAGKAFLLRQDAAQSTARPTRVASLPAFAYRKQKATFTNCK